jgi:hypothetical protein
VSTLNVDKVDPSTGTDLEIGSSGDTITIPSGATIVNSGTATGFGAALTGSTNNTVTTVTAANAISGETNLTFDGTDLTLGTGNVIMGTSGKGIDFSAVTPTAGMTGQLLDDYEEGTWTPTLDNTGGTPSYTWQHGKYTKVGRHVWLVMNIKFTVTPSGVGQVYLSGFPFANVSIAANYWPAFIVPYQGCNYDGDTISGQIPDGGTIAYCEDFTSGSKDTFKASNLGTTVEMEMSCNYPT